MPPCWSTGWSAISAIVGARSSRLLLEESSFSSSPGSDDVLFFVLRIPGKLSDRRSNRDVSLSLPPEVEAGGSSLSEGAACHDFECVSTFPLSCPTPLSPSHCLFFLKYHTRRITNITIAPASRTPTRRHESNRPSAWTVGLAVASSLLFVVGF